MEVFNLIIHLLNSRNKSKEWDIKNIFLIEINNKEEAIIYSKETDYLKLAQNCIESNKLQESGNYLRKEFERIIEELRIINEVGAKEKVSSIIEQLIKKKISSDINIKKMQIILEKTKFYQTILMHPSSHYNLESEIYQKECNGAIVVLNQLKKLINVFKKDKN